MLACLFTVLAFMGFGPSMVTIWMFINTLQLILHTPLMAIPIPSNLHYFLVRYLDVARLQVSYVTNHELFIKYLEPEHLELDYELEREASLLQFCNYK